MAVISYLVNSYSKLTGNFISATKPSKIGKILPKNLRYDVETLRKSPNNVGKHLIPRYLYHLTNEKAFLSMCQDGKINVSKEFCSGIFMFDMTNLLKRWGRKRNWRNLNLTRALISQVSKYQDNLVLLRIPTENLEKSKLIVRCQEIVLEEVRKIASLLTMDDLLARKIPDELKKDFSHYLKGIPAKEVSLLKKRKLSIEYIYPKPILIGSIEVVGQVDMSKICESSKNSPSRFVKYVFKQFLKNQPEEKSLKLLDKSGK